MSVWASHAPPATQAVTLRDVMQEQRVQQQRDNEDKEDEELQRVLQMSLVEQGEQEMPEKDCPLCTYKNTPYALICDVCHTPLDTPNEDADLAMAINLQDEEKKQESTIDLAHRRDPMWRAKHLVEDRRVCDEEEGEEEEEYDEMPEEDVRLQGLVGGRRGAPDWIKLEDGTIITKHDLQINGRQNARIASDRLTGAGDLEGMSIPNTTFNSFKRAVKRTEGVVKGVYVKGKVAREQHATREGVLDPRTRTILYKLINKQGLEEVHGVVKTGKESKVYIARGDEQVLVGLRDRSKLFDQRSVTDVDSNPDLSDLLLKSLEMDEPLPPRASEHTDEGSDSHELASTDLSPPMPHPTASDIAVKVFFTTLNQFSNRAEYVVGDPRYRGTNYTKQTSRQMINTWAEKEFRNLVRVNRAGIVSPCALHQQEHVLLMSFVGKDGWPAPQLREIPTESISRSLWRKLYMQTVGLMRDLWQFAKLVHSDLSEYNILYQDRQCIVIDLGQGIDIGHDDALEFLQKDMTNVTRFFDKQSVSTFPLDIVESFVTEHDVFEDSVLASFAGVEQKVEETLERLHSGKIVVQEAVLSAVDKAKEEGLAMPVDSLAV